MKEFLPWSEVTLQKATEKYLEGRLSILDVQLGGECNFNCKYCDSPDRNKKCTIDFDVLEKLIARDQDLYEWMFICGLGEPLFGPNREKLLLLLALCEKYRIKCSVFTNGSLIDSQIIPFIEKGILFPLIKMDSYSLKETEYLYGSKNANKNLKAINSLFELTKSLNHDYCQVGASIVPTRMNVNEIPIIVEKCLSHNVFPLIGELECAGDSTGSRYDSLCLMRGELSSLKSILQQTIGEEYKIPICPSVMAGIHITNQGIISVDEISGLSCPWFWLTEPRTKELCSIKEIEGFEEADKIIVNYRNAVFEALAAKAKEVEEYPFGGCGGNVKGLLEEYLRIQKCLI